MKYVDMHCDTLTECFYKGFSLLDCALQTSFEKLDKSGCAAQCFAIFTQGDKAALRFEKCLKFYLESLARYGVKSVKNHADLDECLNSSKAGAILTVENLGFINDLSDLKKLAEAGVRMVSLVWNKENAFAYPNLVTENGAPVFGKRESRGLKPLGRQAVEILDALKIIVDVSHLSDGGADEILSDRKIPLVASHSLASSVCGVSRNLTDMQIKKIAACGGVIGVNFCPAFLGGEAFPAVLAHVKHIINTGGEDVVAFGSDFDGISPPRGLETCERMPALIGYLEDNGIRGEALEKLCHKNFSRVFKEVCG